MGRRWLIVTFMLCLFAGAACHARRQSDNLLWMQCNSVFQYIINKPDDMRPAGNEKLRSVNAVTAPTALE